MDVQDTLDDLVTVDPGRARALDALGLDCCCDGDRTLIEACDAAGGLVAALERLWSELEPHLDEEEGEVLPTLRANGAA